MARPITAGKTPTPRSRRRGLLCGSALCGATLFFAVAAQAQTLPGIPAAGAIKFTAGGATPTITAPNANTLDVALNATRTVINWDSFHVSAADAVNFHFGAASDIVLNKSPTQIKVDAGGHVTGDVGGTTGGNIWFYSPGGVLISPNAVMTAGNFVFARGAALDDLLFVADANPLGFLRAASDSLIQIDTISLATSASINATGDIVLNASTGDLNATTVLAAGTATVSATTGGINIGEVTATGAATVSAPAGAITLGQLNGASVSAIGLTTVSVTSASSTSATGDILLNGGTSASLGSGSAGHDLKVQGLAASLGSGTAADSVFVTATTGVASVGGAVTAGNDIEVTATTGSVGAVTANLTSSGVGATDDAHVLVQSTANSVSLGSATTQGTGVAAGDITVSGATGADLGSGHSSQDLKVLGPTASLGSGDAARAVFVTATTGPASVTGAVLAGDDIEVTATTGPVLAGSASLTAGGAGAVGDAHVLVQSTAGSVSVGMAATQGTGGAVGDITISGATTASLGSGGSSRDLSVIAPTANLGFGIAARDLYVTATTGSASVTSQAVAGDDIEVTATTGSVVATGADLKSNATGAVGDAHVLARSTGGTVSVSSAETQGTGGAAGDITIDGATGATLGSGASSRDLKVLGPAAGLGSGSAARDVFVTATTGTAMVTGAVTAGDDIEVTATAGSVVASGASLTSTGAGAVGDTHVLAQSTGGSVALTSAATQGTGGAAGDITVSGATTASLGSGTSSHDIKVLGPSASLGSGGAANSVFVTATTGPASVSGAVSAGNDIEVTAAGSVITTGASLTSTGVGATDDAHVLLKSTGGSVAVGGAATQGTGAAAGDVTVDGATTATVSGTISASRDAQITAGDSVLAAGSTVGATRDVAVSAGAGSVTLGGANAGDDIAVRALAGSITGSGDLQSGQTHDGADPDPAGAADTLAGATMAGHSIDLKAQTIAISGNVAAGRAPDMGETLGAAQVASTLTAEATSPDPAPGTAALQLATGPGQSVTAHSDVSLRAENAAPSSIQTGDVFAGGDVAVDSAAGNITMASALAGDDVVLRALSGAISVSGNVESGRDSPGMTPADAAGAGDALNAARPFSDFDGNPATVFSVVGFDVNIVSQAVHVGGATIAGRQPSTDAPNVAGPVDTTTSDVRIETRLSATPVTGLDPNIDLGSVIATRDMQIDSNKAISTGALIAGRDIAVLGRGAPTPGAAPGDHTGAGATIASAQAGDDALAFSIYGRTHILGSVSSGQPLLRLVPTNDRVIDGATEAADQLAIYLHYFDLDDASAPYVLPGGVVHIVGQGVTVGGAITAHGAGSNIRILSSADISVTGAVNAGGIATFQTQPGGGAITLGAVTAAGDVSIDGGGTGTGVLASGTITSTNGQVAIRARDGTDISLAGVSAGDDVVIRGAGALTTSGTINAGGGTDAAGLGEALVTSDGALTLEGHSYDLTGHNVDIIAGSVTSTGTLMAVGDVRVQSVGTLSLAGLTAGRDVLVDGGSTVLTGALSAGRDIGVRSTGAGTSVTVGNASAGDDLVIRANGSIFATGTLTTGGGTDSAASDQAGDLMFGAAKSNVGGDLNLTGQNIDLFSTAGSIQVSGAVNAVSDARFQTGAITGGSVSVAGVTAGHDVLLDGGGAGTGVTATGTLKATAGDVAVRARDGSAISLKAITAGDDAVIRSTGGVTLGGALNAGGGTDNLGLGDALAGTAALTLEGHAYDLGGHNVEIVAGTVTAPNILTASGDVRIQTTGAVSLAGLSAGRDVLVDSGSTVLTGALSAGRDIGVRSTGAGASVTIGNASAGDDLVVRANGSIFATGTLTTGGGTDSAAADQAGDLMFGAAKSNVGGDLNLAGQNIDLLSTAGSIQVSGAVNAVSDARFQTGALTGGSVSVAGVTAGRDVLLDGGGAGTGVTATGTLTATGGDVAIRARDGSAISLKTVTAADDLVIRSSGAVQLANAISAGGGSDSLGLGDALSGTAALTVAGHAYDLVGGHNIEIVAGSVTTNSTLMASGDVRLQTTGAVSLANLTAGRDVLVDSGSTVLTGVLSAQRDIGVRSTGVGTSVTIGNASAGDDLVIRAKGSIFATGTLTSGGGTDSAAADQAGDLIFSADKTTLATALTLSGGRNIDVRSSAGAIVASGLVNAASDARFQTGTTTGGAITVGTVTAGRDLLLDGGGAGPNGVLATGTLTATAGDVAIRARDGSGISLKTVTAGDDAVIRSTGAILLGGTVNAGGGTDAVGLGDNLAGAAGALTVAGHAYDLGGQNIDLVGGSVTTSMTLAAVGDVRLQTTGAVSLANLTAGRDVLVDSGSTILTGVLSAQRDIGVRSTGVGTSVTIGNASAGDDLVIRAKGSIFTTGTLTSGSGTDSTAADQAGDLIFSADVTNVGGALTLTGGRSIDVRSSAGAIVASGVVNAASDARFQTGTTTGGSITVGTVNAGRDILLDGGGAGPNGVLAGTLTANGDVAIRVRDGSTARLADISAGDDVAIRAGTGAVIISGPVHAGGGTDSAGLGDALRNTAALTVSGHAYDLSGNNIDITGGTISTPGLLSALGDVRLQTSGAIDVVNVTAGRDVLADSGSTITTGVLSAGRDIGLRSTGAGGSVTIGNASAGDDLVIRAKGSIFATGSLNSGGGTDSNGADQAGDLIFGADASNLGGALNLVGRTVDLRSTAGAIQAAGAINAATDARLQTATGTGGAITVAAVTAGRSIFLDGGGAGPNGVLATGTLTATSGDVAVRARDGSAISLADVTAGDDVVLRAVGAIGVGGAVNAGGGTDSAGLGDTLATTEGAVTLEGHAYDLSGHNIDIVGGSVTTVGLLTATNDVRVQSIGALNLGALTAGRDVLVDGASTVLTGQLTAGRDVGARSTGDGASVTVGGASAGDDVVIRAKGSIFVTGALSAGAGPDSTATDQAGDLMFGAAKSNLGADLDLIGQSVDVRSAGGSISVLGAVTATTDARFQTEATTGGSVSVAAVTAGRDVLLDGGGVGNGAVATGTLTATSGDVAVRARDGAAINLAGIVAGDDVVLRTTGSATVAGPVSAGSGADSAGLGDVLLTTNGVVTLEGQAYDLTGHDVDIVAGSVTTIGTLTAAGLTSDVRVQSLGAINLGALTAGRDVLVNGASTVATGLLTAGRDVGARSTGDGAQVTIGGASAGDDVVIRAKGSILVSGPLIAGGAADSTAADQAGDLMFGVAKSALAGALDLVGNMVDVRSSAGSIQVLGATSAITDARFQTATGTGGSVTVGAVTAGRDILLDGAAGLGSNGAQATGTLTATSGDVAVRARDGSAISLADVTAGDDVVLRSTGDIQGGGTITTNGAGSTEGLGDKLIDPSESGALTVAGLTFGLGDSDIDIVGNLIGIFRTAAVGGVRILAGGGSLMGGASAGTDILIDSTSSLTIGDLNAVGDIALRSKSGSLTVGSLTAGDDIVLRAAQGVTAGMLKAGSAEHTGVGDMLFNSDPITLGGSFDVQGGTVDVKSASGPITVAGAQAPGDIRLQTTGGTVTISGAITAGRDFFADGGSVAATGGLTAARDVALFGRSGGVAVATVTAGNDFVVRATGDVTASGDLKAGMAPASGGIGDRLIAAGGGSATLFGEAADAGVGVIDLRGANITLSGAVEADAGASLRLQSTGATTLVAATAAGDISIDAAGDLTAGDISAGRDVALRSTAGGVTIASAKAGDDIVLRAANSIAVSGALTAGQGADAAGAGDGLFALSPTGLGGDFDLAGGDVDAKSTSGGVSALGAITAPNDVRLQASGAVVTGSVTAGRDLLLDGGSVTGADLHAGRDAAIRAQTDGVSLASIAAGDDVVLRAAKDVRVTGAISAGGAADSDGVGDRLFATDKTALNGDLDLAGADIDVRARGAITVGGAAIATGDARFQTIGVGAINLATVTAGGDVLADGAAVQASGALTATRDVAVRGRTGAVQLASIKAGDDIAVRAGGDVSVSGTLSSGSGASATGAADRLISAAESGPIMRLVDPLAAAASIEGFTLANGDIDIRSGGAISLGGDVNATGSASGVHLQAAGKISAGAVTAGDSIFARGGDFALGGAWRANSARLEITATGGLALGEGVSAASGGVALSSSAVGLIDAPTLQIFLGDSSGTMRGSQLSIGALNVDVSKIKTSLELYAGASSQVLISGAFAPSASGVNATMVRIGAPNADVGDWTPGSIRVIANSGGSIGVSTTATGRTFSDIRAFGAVELNATDDILFGYQDFIDKISATTAANVSQVVRQLTAPQTVGGQRMLITAGTLILRANGKVAQQDTEGLLGSNPMGLYLFGGSATAPQLVLGRTSGKSVGSVTLPDYIELNGALTTGATILTGTNASLANVIAFSNGVTPNAYYRINSCAIMQPGSCTSSSVHASVTISPDSLTNLTVQDRTAAAGTADPTVASATNEESWKDQK